MKRTKIIATIGPSTGNAEKIQALYEAGINILRFNFSHANYEESLRLVNLVNELNASGKTQLSTLLDTKGPEIRTGTIDKERVYKQGDVFSVYTDSTKLGENDLFCDYEFLSEDIELGNIIAVDSGLLNIKVLSKGQGKVEVEALNGAVIGSRRHINLPGVKLRLPGITDKDKEDILWGIQNGFSFIAASFVRNAKNVAEIRMLLDDNGGEHIEIISKVENQEGIENLAEIVAESNGVMVARGDLGIEVPIEKLAVYQKDIIDKCRASGKNVVIATHILESMIDNPFPTRAESSDLYNGVLQQPDMLMFSGETAIGKFPIESVKIMTRIIEEAESHIQYDHVKYENHGLNERDIEKKALIKSGIIIGEKLEAKAVLVFTKSGKLARIASAFRPSITTYAFTNNINTVKLCNAYFGINPFLLDGWEQTNYDETIKNSLLFLLEKNILTLEDKIIAISDDQKGEIEIPFMKIITAKDFI